MDKKSPLFWQPKINFLNLLLQSKHGHLLLVILNYVIWVFFFGISYLLVKSNPNIFWQLLFATVASELIERFIKAQKLWQRPLFAHTNSTPFGLVDSWYKSGSFPSGHTIKTSFFLLFILQYSILNPVVFLLVTLPLLVFRVISGFHYPIDIFGGAIIGVAIWMATYSITMPQSLNIIIQNIFNFVFFIK